MRCSITVHHFHIWTYTFTLLPNSYSGNDNLRKDSRRKTPLYVIIGSTVGAAVLLLATVISCLFKHKGKNRYYEQSRTLNQNYIPFLSEIIETAECDICLHCLQTALFPTLLKVWSLLKALVLQKLHIATAFLKSKNLQIILRKKLVLVVLELFTMEN